MNKPVGSSLPLLCLASGHGKLECMKGILEAGVDIEASSALDGPPLGLACAMGQLEAVKFLIARGANTSWMGSDGQITTALEKAKGQPHVIRWLQNNDSRPANLRKTSASTNSSASSKKKRVDYRLKQECNVTIFDLDDPRLHSIRRRNSFILDYTLRDRHPFNPPFDDAAYCHIPYNIVRRIAVEQLEPGPQGRMVPPWDSRMLRESYAEVYCRAICRSRSMTPPLRYSVYPLFSHVARVSRDGPWESF